MSDIKKLKATAKSLDLHAFKGFIPAQDNPGSSPVNAQGQIIDKAGLLIDWPNSVAVHDRDDDKVSNYAYDPSLSLEGDKYGRVVYQNDSDVYSTVTGKHLAK